MNAAVASAGGLELGVALALLDFFHRIRNRVLAPLLAVTHPTAVRTGVCNFVVDQLDEGTPPGVLVMQTSGGSAVATLTFSTTAFGAAASGVATAAAITSDTNAAGGTITKAELRNAAGTAKILCSVTATGGGGDIELSSVVVSAGQTVSLTSLTYEAMP